MTTFFGPGTRMMFRHGKVVHLKRAWGQKAVCGAWERPGTRYREPTAYGQTGSPNTYRYLPGVTCGNCTR